MGVVFRNNRKRVSLCRCLDGYVKETLRNIYGVGSPTVGANSSVRMFIFMPSHNYITEISLHMTLNNNSIDTQFLSLSEYGPYC